LLREETFVDIVVAPGLKKAVIRFVDFIVIVAACVAVGSTVGRGRNFVCAGYVRAVRADRISMKLAANIACRLLIVLMRVELFGV
jgi:hypothetical protein